MNSNYRRIIDFLLDEIEEMDIEHLLGPHEGNDSEDDYIQGTSSTELFINTQDEEQIRQTRLCSLEKRVLDYEQKIRDMELANKGLEEMLKQHMLGYHPNYPSFTPHYEPPPMPYVKPAWTDRTTADDPDPYRITIGDPPYITAVADGNLKGISARMAGSNVTLDEISDRS